MNAITTKESLQTLPVVIAYVGEVVRKDWGNQKCDQWRVEIKSKSGFHCFDYFTGLGLRSKNRPQKPTVADVMYSLISDASAAYYNFADWCDEYGYSDDSISAMNIYKACLETATALRKHIGRETLEQVRVIVQDM